MLGMIGAFLGPWVFDRVDVPAQYPCSPPYIRLYGDFCGFPYSGFQVVIQSGVNFIAISIGLLTGKFVFPDRVRELLISLLLLLPLLPVISTLLLILRPTHPSRRMFRLILWILAIGVSIFLSSMINPKQFLHSWGLWLYLGLAISALILEYKTRSQGEKPESL